MLYNSIYDITIKDVDGNTLGFAQFKGKKMLFVNTASSGSYIGQLAGLEQLYQKYKDSLVIIAIPSNTFHNESKSNAEIKSFIQKSYDTHFIIAEKAEVEGASQSPLYAWLTHQSQNGMMENTVDEDFYKFLVNEEGKLVGIFAPSVDPMSEELQSAIKN